MKINVTQEDIDAKIGNPVALAVARATGKKVIVDRRYIIVDDVPFRSPVSAEVFTRAYYMGLDLEPFSFEL